MKKKKKIKQNIYIWNRTKRKSEFLYPCKCPPPPLKSDWSSNPSAASRPQATDGQTEWWAEGDKKERRRMGEWMNFHFSLSLSWNHKNSSEEKVQFTCKFRTKISQNPMQVAWEVREPVGPSSAVDASVKKRNGLIRGTTLSHLKREILKK